MRKLLTIMWKDVNVLFRDGAAVILIIAGPLVLALGMGLVTGSFNRSDDESVVSRIPIIIVDRDGSDFAAALTDLLTSDDLSDLLAPQTGTDAAAARALVDEGDAVAAIIIPPGFSASFLPDMTTGALPDPVAVEVYGDAGSPIRAGIVRSIVTEFAARAQAGVTTLQISLGELAASGAVAPADLPATGRALGERLFAGDEATATTSLVVVRRESAAAGGSDDFNPMAYIAPGMALLFLMYAVTLGARTLLTERREGTLARMLAAPVTNGQVLGGKVAGIFLGGVLQLGVLIVITSLLFRLRWGSPLGVVLLVLAAAAAATGWGLLLAAFARTSSQVTRWAWP